MSTRRGLALLAVAALAAVLTGCSAVDGPTDLVPSGGIQPPQPFGVAVGTAALRGLPKPDTSCGDPTVSLPPDPAATGDAVARIKHDGTLTVGVDNSTYLFGFRDPKTGDLQGFDIGLAHEMAQAILGDPKKIEFTEIDSAHRVDALRSGAVDMVVRTMTITCARAGEVAFSTPYFTAQQRVLVPSDSLANGLGSLGGKKVCAAAGSTSLRRIADAGSHPIPVAVPDWSDCLVLLQQREVAAVSTDDTILAGMHAQDPDTKIVGSAVATEPYGIAVPKDDTALLRRVNAELDAIRGDGTWQKLYDRWIGDRLGRAASMPPANYRS